MTDTLKQKPLTVGVLAGVTAIVGGIEPASANPITESFNVTVTDSAQINGTDGTSGNFEDSSSDPTEFSLFDDQGGTLQLTSVEVVATTVNESRIGAFVNGDCVGEFGDCSGESVNETTFSAQIDLGGGIDLLPLTQMLSLTAEDSCSISEGIGCSFVDEPFNSFGDTDVSDFAVTITDQSTLDLFVGTGFYDVIPALALDGSFEVIANEAFVEESSAGVQTDWLGSITVTYESREVEQPVPLPGTLFLFGTGLAAAGLGRVRRKKA